MESPFLALPETAWTASNALAFAVRDGYPVSPGHTLIVPRRVVATWFEATRAEQWAMLALVDAVKRALDAEFRPHGYNVGFNAGAAAGQTVPHLHLHVIPRFAGDVPDPRGGVRQVIPARANYLVPGGLPPLPQRTLAAVDASADGATVAGVRLFTGATPSLWDGLRAVGQGARRVDIVVAYAQPRGVDLVAPWLEAVARAAAPVRLLVGTYLNGTHVDALRRILRLAQTNPTLAVRLLVDPSVHFHPKVYRVVDAGGRTHLFVGSSNLSYSALTGRAGAEAAVEWNLALDDAVAPAAVTAANERLEDLFATAGVPLSEEVIADYAAQCQKALPPAALVEDEPLPAERLEARPAQQAALVALASLRAQGYRRALVVAATGLGKTVLAALDSVAAAPEGRVLFLAHRETLLRQARDAFARVRPGEPCGLVCDGRQELCARHLFVSVGSAHHIDPAAFAYVVVDEAHHSAARTYRALFDRLSPGAFVLGLTATPDRLDGGDIYALFDNVVAYEVGLLGAIGHGWLVPFHYYGLPDTLDLGQRLLREVTPRDLEDAVLAEARMTHVVEALRDPKYHGARTLAFCVSIRHAQEVAARLDRVGVSAAAVHSGPSSLDPATAIARLRSGALRVLCVVDMFNEGVDVPEVDRVAFLRPTDSPVVFLQQLGRGLRLAPDKRALVVVDFVANHRRAELRPEWLGVAPGDVMSVPQGDAYQHRFADGRTVFFDPAAVEVLRALGTRRYSLRDRMREVFDRLRAEDSTGPRPTYRQFLARCGLAHGTVRSLFGGWAEFLEDRGALTPQDQQLARSPAARGLLDAVESTAMSAPYKMLLLSAMAEAREARCTLARAAELVGDSVRRRHPAASASPTVEKGVFDSQTKLRKKLRERPVKHLVESAPRYFRFDPKSDQFSVVLARDVPVVDQVVALEERAEARLFDFLRRRPEASAELAERKV